jgi:hypothetical protein
VLPQPSQSFDLGQAIDVSVAIFIEEYRECRGVRYLTESDVVHRIAVHLEKQLEGADYRVHLELRPYRRSEGSLAKILEEGAVEWRTAKEDGSPLKENDGARLDIAVVKGTNGFEEALQQARLVQSGRMDGDLRYWRMLSYPIEAIAAALEVKVRVRGNERRIRKDIDKLALIGEGRIVRMVIVDRCATNRVQQLLGTVEEQPSIKGVHCHIETADGPKAPSD